jgi:glyoxylase-like metal-dependent hydrolase (beta-lactamase superfamily II)
MRPMRLTDGIYKVDGMRVANVYLVVIEDGLLLVDSGMPGNAKRILAFTKNLGYQPRDLRFIVLTHCDIDHVGSVAKLKELTGAQVAIHELDAPVLSGDQKPQKGGLAMVVIYRLLWFRPVVPDLLLTDRDTIGGFHVMHAPGHTAGSLVLYRDDGVVFSGDALLSNKDGQVRPPDPRLALNRAEALASAERIKALPTRLLLTGHGAPVYS